MFESTGRQRRGTEGKIEDPSSLDRKLGPTCDSLLLSLERIDAHLCTEPYSGERGAG